MIPMIECIPRSVYRLLSRNLLTGVYDGKGGFIGVREKFGSRYLFTEYHYDTGAPYGTASPIVVICALPEHIELRERGDSYDEVTGRLTEFDAPIRAGGKGWYFLDTGEPSEAIRSVSPDYEPLFAFLESLPTA